MGKSFEYEFELEKHIHEQYAINNNANVSSFISFIIALFTLFGFYGYCYWLFVNQIVIQHKYGISLDDFCILSLFVVIVFAFLFLISQHLGYAQRRDQIIIDRIRNENYQKERLKKIYSKVFSSKGKSYWSFVQNFFNLFCLVFLVAFLLVCFMSIHGIVKNYSIFWSIHNINWPPTLFFVCTPLIFLYCACKRCHLFRKYLMMVSPKYITGYN